MTLMRYVKKTEVEGSLMEEFNWTSIRIMVIMNAIFQVTILLQLDLITILKLMVHAFQIKRLEAVAGMRTEN